MPQLQRKLVLLGSSWHAAFAHPYHTSVVHPAGRSIYHVPLNEPALYDPLEGIVEPACFDCEDSKRPLT